MKKSVQNLKVITNMRLNADCHLLKMQAEEPLGFILPGQFANILVKNTPNVFLRRPFSIYSVDYKHNTISVLIKVIGEGTQILSKTDENTYLDVIFPLGNGFTMPEADEEILLVGGGSGIAALMNLTQEIHKKSNRANILLGARSAGDLFELDQFGLFGKVFTTTEDGSHGEKGYVTDHQIFKNDLKQFSRIYCCGPDPMMKAIAKKAKSASVFCEVSLENTMACGFGVCLCCVTETTQGHKCVCTDGPVFNINKLKWQI